MSRLIEWEGQPFALLVETAKGDFSVPPIVIDDAGDVVEGLEVLQAIVEAGKGVTMPIVRGASPAILAEIDQRMAKLNM